MLLKIIVLVRLNVYNQAHVTK